MSTTGVLPSNRHAGPTTSPLRHLAIAWRAQTWRNVLYLLLALPLGAVYFAVLVAGLAAGAGLAVVVVGLGVLALTMYAWRGMAALERALARTLLRVRIHPPADRDRGLPWRNRAELWVRDPVTWKSLVFLLSKLPMGIVAYSLIAFLGFSSLVLAVAPAIVAFTPVIFFGWEMETPAQALPFVPLGLVACLVSLHLFNGLAWLYAVFARVMLGPSTVELRERVAGLRDASARILAAADDERRRIERDLHDGAQQRLVALNLTLGVAETRVATDPEGAARLIAQARAEAVEAVRELRELARGIHPALLADRGLGAALEALAARAPVPVAITGIPSVRLPAAVEATAYYVTAEALTNMAKHANASGATIRLDADRSRLLIEVRDDGDGGAHTAPGGGLHGLADRVDALDGRLELDSPPGGGTAVIAEIPLESR